jgi:glutamate-1-semialdehyde 2,1-aminomutase
VNAFGSVVTPFFTAERVRDFRSAVTADTGRYASFFRGMLARGIYPPPSQFEAWFLSTAHTRADVDRTVKAARAVMGEIGRAG